MMEYSSVINKDENFAICSNMDGLYAKWNKSEKNTVYHLYVDSKKHKKLVNLVNKQTYRYRELVVNGGERVGEGQYRGQELRGTNYST